MTLQNRLGKGLRHLVLPALSTFIALDIWKCLYSVFMKAMQYDLHN